MRKVWARPQCARSTLSALTRQENTRMRFWPKPPSHVLWRLILVHSIMDNKKTQKKFHKHSICCCFICSRSRLSVATATRSSSAGLEGTLSFLPNGRTSNLPTSKNRVGIRFSVDWECRLLVYRWWQREVTIWGLGRRTKRSSPPPLALHCRWNLNWESEKQTTFRTISYVEMFC